MKKAFYLFSTMVLLFAACGKDNDIYPERVLYKRLAAQGGVWDVEKIEHYSYDGQGNETFDSTYYRERQYVFYEHSEVFDYVEQDDLSYLAVAVLNKGQGGYRYSLWAEQDRIIFEDFSTSVFDPQYTFTVRDNKPNKQVWDTYIVNPNGDDERITVYLKHCPNCEPYYPVFELGGI